MHNSSVTETLKFLLPSRSMITVLRLQQKNLYQSTTLTMKLMLCSRQSTSNKRTNNWSTNFTALVTSLTVLSASCLKLSRIDFVWSNVLPDYSVSPCLNLSHYLSILYQLLLPSTSLEYAMLISKVTILLAYQYQYLLVWKYFKLPEILRER